MTAPLLSIAMKVPWILLMVPSAMRPSATASGQFTSADLRARRPRFWLAVGAYWVRISVPFDDARVGARTLSDTTKPTASLETAGFVLGRVSSASASPVSRGFAADDSPTAQRHFLRTETGPFQFIVKRLTELMGEAELRDREGDGGWPARLEGRDLRRGRGARRAASD